MVNDCVCVCVFFSLVLLNIDRYFFAIITDNQIAHLEKVQGFPNTKKTFDKKKEIHMKKGDIFIHSFVISRIGMWRFFSR